MRQIQLKPSKGLAEQIEVLRHRVMSSLNGKSANPFVLAFVSCEAGEGASSVAVNFAASAASDGRRSVLLMDGNLRAPSLQRLLEGMNGVSQSMSEDPTSSGKDLSTSVWKLIQANDNLDVLVSLQHEIDPGNVFGGKVFGEFLKRARSRYDLIAIDSPPLSASSAATIIATKADGVILVIEAERVRREVIQRAVTQLEDAGAHLLGVVLNKRRFPIPNFIYRMI